MSYIAGCRNANMNGSVNTANSGSGLLRIGMEVARARLMLSEVQAEEITAKIDLPRDSVSPPRLFSSYRLKSGTVIEIYGRQENEKAIVILLVVSKDKLEQQSEDDYIKHRKNPPHLDLISVKEIDLK